MPLPRKGRGGNLAVPPVTGHDNPTDNYIYSHVHTCVGGKRVRLEFRAEVRRTVRGTHYVVIPARDVRWLEQETGQPIRGKSLVVVVDV